MSTLYPEIEPYDHGLLDVGDGHHLYWECCGNPTGKSAVVLHGGPGSGCSAHMRRYFDPAAYRIVLFDQRNCGRSTPHASDPNVDLSTNTTEHLLADMEQLRLYLGIERWLIYGGSWGSTLGLAYAQRYPQHVTEIILVGVTTTRRSEIDWLYRGMAPLFPAHWARFRAGVPEQDRDGDLLAAYYRLLHDADPAVRQKAAQDFHDWEFAAVSIDPNATPPATWLDPDYQMARARIVTHYFHHNAWLEDGALLRNADKLAGIPGVMVQGRLDLAGPLVMAWELDNAWPDGELVVISNAGHSAGDPGMTEAAIVATKRFATQLIGHAFRVQPQPIAQITTLNDAIKALASPIDAFLEEHILSAQLFAITDAATNQPIGHVAIHNKSLLTHFYLRPAYRRYGQPLYHDLLQRYNIKEALVPTCDEFFLSHALDRVEHLHKQAYFFVAGASLGAWDDMDGLHFRRAKMADYETTAQLNGDFLDMLARRIEAGEIHIGELNGTVVTLGIIEQGRLLRDCASIGMLVAPEQRQRGIGTRMLRYLRSVCEQDGLHPLAGCGYDNVLSKRTLEAAGMVTATRLLRIAYVK